MSAAILSKRRSRGKPVEVETLLEESEDDEDDVLGPNRHSVEKNSDSRTKFNKSISQDDSSEIVLDDSDSDIEIEEIEPDSPIVSLTNKNKSTLDENKVKSILNKVASKNSSSINSSSELPSGLAVTRTHNIGTEQKLTLSSTGLLKNSEPSTPRLVLKKVGSRWLNSSTPQDIQPKSVNENHDSNTSNSDEDFVPLKVNSRSKAKDSDTDEDSFETSKLNRSTRSTRSSMNVTRSDLSEDVTLDTTVEIDDEIAEELRKLEALQQILAKHNPNDARRADTVPHRKKSQKKKKLKQSKTTKAIETPKPKPPEPRVIDRGPIDCFDDLIVETTAGFPCNYCDSKEMFKKRREMIYHMQTKHEDELNEEQKNGDLSGLFPCEVCNIAFCSKFILRTHKKAHEKSNRKGCDKYYQYYLRFGQPALV